MRVLYLTTNPNLGSTARILQSWLLLGRHRGLDGLVVAQKPGVLSRWLADNGVPHLVDPMPLPNRRWPFPALWHAARVAWWARHRGVEVIHCNEHDVYPFALLVRRFLPRPLVCYVRFRVARPYCQWIFGKGRYPEALLWTSLQQREDCAEAVAGLVPEADQQVIHLGLDLREFGNLAAGRAHTRSAWGLAPDATVIGTASALKPIKRIEDFIDLVARLARDDPRVVAVIAGDAMPGDEGYRDRLRTQVEQVGLSHRFRWLGNLEQVEPFYHAIDLFVSTSEYETFGNSVCEAMACSRPVVAYRGGSVHEVVGDAGLVVETGDRTALLAAARRLVQEPDQRELLGRRGRDRVAEHFNPEQGLSRVLDLYRRLTRERTRPALSHPNH